MKRIVGLVLFSLAILGVTARTQAQQQSIIVSVPFEFVVGNKVLPAGTYTVTFDPPGLLQVESGDGRLAAKIAATLSYHDAGDSSKLSPTSTMTVPPITGSSAPPAMNADLPLSTLEKKVRSAAQEARVNKSEKVLLEIK